MEITDPLKRIELFKAITSPAYIIATLENTGDVSSEFFCPVKKCFEYACEANAKAKAMPEYKREYQEIEHRCENYMISLLEQTDEVQDRFEVDISELPDEVQDRFEVDISELPDETDLSTQDVNYKKNPEYVHYFKL